MITKEEMISKIYEKVSDKTLSFGCKMVEWWTTYIFLYKKSIDSSNKEYNIYLNPITKLEYQKSFIDKIIWHPVMIWDILDYIYINKDELFFQWDMDMQNFASYFSVSIWWLLEKWEHKRKPLEEQSDDCIKYIYNLIK